MGVQIVTPYLDDKQKLNIVFYTINFFYISKDTLDNGLLSDWKIF